MRRVALGAVEQQHGQIEAPSSLLGDDSCVHYGKALVGEAVADLERKEASRQRAMLDEI